MKYIVAVAAALACVVVVEAEVPTCNIDVPDTKCGIVTEYLNLASLNSQKRTLKFADSEKITNVTVANTCSETKPKKGSNYNWDKRSLWVDSGLRAVFKVTKNVTC